MKAIETKGDVCFFLNEKNKMFQQIGSGEMLPVKDGKITYKPIKKVGLVEIKYQLNGMNGFSLFKGRTLLEDNIWSLERAEDIAKTL